MEALLDVNVEYVNGIVSDAPWDHDGFLAVPAIGHVPFLCDEIHFSPRMLRLCMISHWGGAVKGLLEL